MNEVSVDLTLELKLGDVLVEKAQQLATGLILFHFLFALFVNLQFSVVQNVCELEVSLLIRVTIKFTYRRVPCALLMRA